MMRLQTRDGWRHLRGEEQRRYERRRAIRTVVCAALAGTAVAILVSHVIVREYQPHFSIMFRATP